jgi:hypothetical protein
MQPQIGKVYKIKEGSKEKCGIYMIVEGTYIKVTNITDGVNLSYNILKNGKKVDDCVDDYCDCFTPDDLTTPTWETIELLGRTYKKADIESALKGIKQCKT